MKPLVGPLGPVKGGTTVFSQDGNIMLKDIVAADDDCAEYEDPIDVYKGVAFSTYSGDKKSVITFEGNLTSYVSIVACVLLC